MRALTVKQPFAAQIAYGIKKIEYRTWKTDYRGPMLITASAAPKSLVLSTGQTIPSGCMVCVVELIKITGEEGDYKWHFKKPRPVVPARIKGKLQLWECDDSTIDYLPPDMEWMDYQP